MAYELFEPEQATLFLLSIIEETELIDGSPDVKMEMLNTLKSGLRQAISNEVVSRLSNDDVAALDQMAERRASLAEFQDFIKARIENFEQLVAKTMMEFRAQYVETE